jgi:cbb3-type cytochrome oxidase subunit 1
METIFQPILIKNQKRVKGLSVISKFMAWCESQEKNRLGWLGGILAIHGCVLTPITLFAVILSGTNFALYIATLLAMAIAVITNLAAMPTKVTIPAFLVSVLIDIVVIALCIVAGFSLAATQI